MNGLGRRPTRPCQRIDDLSRMRFNGPKFACQIAACQRSQFPRRKTYMNVILIVLVLLMLFGGGGGYYYGGPAVGGGIGGLLLVVLIVWLLMGKRV